MENFSEAEGAMQRMGTSEGALSQANELYLNSVQAHVQQLKNAFTEFSQSAISAEFISQFVNFVKVLLQATSGVLKFINALGGLRTVIPLAVSLFAIFKGDAIISSVTKIVSGFKNFGKVAKSSLSSLVAGQTAAAGSTGALTAAEEGNIVTTGTMAIAEEEAGNAALSMGSKMQMALGIIGLIAMAVSAAISLISNVVRQAHEWAEASAEIGVKAGENATDLISNYQSYVSMVDAGETSTEEFASTQDALRQSLGLTASEFNRLAGSTDGYSEALRQAAVQQLELDISSQRYGLEAQKSLTQEEINKSLGSLLTSMPNINDTLGLIVDDPTMALNVDYFVEHLDSIKSKLAELKKETKDGDQAYESLLSYFDRMSTATAEYSKQVNSLNHNIVQKSILELGKASVETADDFEEYRNKVIEAVAANNDFHGSEQQVIDTVDALLSASGEFAEFYTEAEKAALGTTAVARGLQGIQDVANGTAASVAALDEALKGDDYDTGMEKRVGYYQKLLEEVQGENWGGKHYAALADYFGVDINQSVDAQIAAIETLSRYFSDADQGMYNFLMDINEKVPAAIASFNSETGTLKWDSAELDQFATSMGLTRDALIDLLDAYIQHVPPSEWLKLPADEAASWLEQDRILQDLGDTMILNRQKFDELAASAGVDADELLASIRELSDYAGDNLIEINLDLQGAESAEAAANNIKAFLADTASYGLTAEQQIQAIASSLSVLDEQSIIDILVNLDLPTNTIDQIKSTLSEQYGINVDTAEADQNLSDVAADMTSIKTEASIMDGMSIAMTLSISGLATAEARLQHIQSMMNSMGSVSGGGTVSGGRGQHVSGGGRITYATGTRHSIAGPALLGDEYSATGKPKPELVVSKGGAYLAGINGPTVSKLNAGDIVYTYRETKQILGNNLNKINSIPAFASGTASRYWNKISGSAGSFSSSTAYSSYYGTRAGSGSSGSSASSSGSGDNWFEQQYELHNHYRKLDQETDAAYLTWLTSAWKQAYAQGVIELKDAHKYEEEAYELMKKIAADRFNEEYKTHQHNVAIGQETDQEYYSWLEWRHQVAYANNEITLEEYWKYQEEVYKKAKELVNDYFNDIDKKIDMLENAGKSDQEIIKWDETGMAFVEEQIAKLKKEGKDNNDSTVQDLQKTWWGYYNDRKKREEGITKDAKSAAKELVDYRMKMLKKDLDTEKDNLNSRLKNLQDFYSKQKDMLQDSYDEDKYLDEQAKKRKAVTDLEIQLAQIEYDNSAWAQKRRLELSQQLLDAQKELADFEKEHALEVAKEKLDAIQQLQEDELQSQIDAIEKTSQSEAEIYQRALKDVQHGGQDLYEAMVEYNNWEGTGNPEDISEMWDEAYTSLKKYREQFGEYYKDIQLTYGTDTTPAVVDTSKIDAGLNPVKPKLEPEVKKTEPTKVTTPAPKAKPAVKADPVKGSAVRLKSSGKLARTSYDSPSLTPASWVKGRTLYVQAVYSGRNAPYHIGTSTNFNDSSSWVGWVNKWQLEGYAKGTRNAVAGLHEINERGDEALFKTSDGSSYRLFSGGEHVFNSRATDFLYDFANNPAAALAGVLGAAGAGIGSEIKNNTLSQNISLGDIYIQGSANEKTISEIRREKRAEMDYMLKELNRLNK